MKKWEKNIEIWGGRNKKSKSLIRGKAYSSIFEFGLKYPATLSRDSENQMYG
jgi:hypothetical protein